MPTLSRRVASPSLFNDPDLGDVRQRFIYLGMHAIAEDGACLRWDARIIKSMVVPYDDDITQADVQAVMDSLVERKRAVPYEAGDVKFAFIIDFPIWQQSLTRWYAPKEVPLHPNVSYEPFDSRERAGSGIYTWPDGSRTGARSTKPNPTEPKEAAPQPAPQPADETDDAEGASVPSQWKPGEWEASEAARRRAMFDGSSNPVAVTP